MTKTKLLSLHLVAALTCGAAFAQAADIGKKAYDRGYTTKRFEAADQNGDGFLTRKEASARLKAFEGVKGSERFSAADTNGDGLLSLDEAAARKSVEKKHGTEVARKTQDRFYNRERFDEVDANDDGYVSREEAAASKTVADKLGGKRFDRADTDGDGRLSLSEAKQRVAKERKAF
ncbi:MAG: hypothetical protein U9Q81_01330 [Pseudomonadota bacterium]|nr:hypothetical protein [Pseudomonadota bacterium]